MTKLKPRTPVFVFTKFWKIFNLKLFLEWLNLPNFIEKCLFLALPVTPTFPLISKKKPFKFRSLTKNWKNLETTDLKANKNFLWFLKYILFIVLLTQFNKNLGSFIKKEIHNTFNISFKKKPLPIFDWAQLNFE